MSVMATRPVHCVLGVVRTSGLCMMWCEVLLWYVVVEYFPAVTLRIFLASEEDHLHVMMCARCLKSMGGGNA